MKISQEVLNLSGLGLLWLSVKSRDNDRIIQDDSRGNFCDMPKPFSSSCPSPLLGVKQFYGRFNDAIYRLAFQPSESWQQVAKGAGAYAKNGRFIGQFVRSLANKRAAAIRAPAWRWVRTTIITGALKKSPSN